MGVEITTSHSRGLICSMPFKKRCLHLSIIVHAQISLDSYKEFKFYVGSLADTSRGFQAGGTQPINASVIVSIEALDRNLTSPAAGGLCYDNPQSFIGERLKLMTFAAFTTG
jgi:hypothetical protein